MYDCLNGPLYATLVLAEVAGQDRIAAVLRVWMVLSAAVTQVAGPGEVRLGRGRLKAAAPSVGSHLLRNGNCSSPFRYLLNPVGRQMSHPAHRE
jgi:hypothetical protein